MRTDKDDEVVAVASDDGARLVCASCFGPDMRRVPAKDIITRRQLVEEQDKRPAKDLGAITFCSECGERLL